MENRGVYFKFTEMRSQLKNSPQKPPSGELKLGGVTYNMTLNEEGNLVSTDTLPDEYQKILNDEVNF